MKRMLQLLLGFGLGCLVILFSGVPSAAVAPVQAAALPAISAKPINGWRVCQDLGSGTIPGYGTRQRFKLCQGDGWVVEAFCLEVGKTPPPLNTMCSYVSDTRIWCGEAYQYLEEFGVLATAAPTTVPSATATRTSTSTATSTRTTTPAATQTGTRAATSVQRPSATAAPGSGVRTRPGGPGNLEVFLPWILLAAVGLPAAALGGRALLKAHQRRA